MEYGEKVLSRYEDDRNHHSSQIFKNMQCLRLNTPYCDKVGGLYRIY
jgi:hypothetical protein